ncbi:transposase [Bradyrhizobium vignae]|uniref:Transposase n=1 Tax=Bradyrhizobium vignae TaxID=1549949 RepID=A0A2U3QA33_9BRAD|nr:transposase [Bradyrhizobium vignae]SPP98275.1 protein of unknown function [Bradyrhizobium vignae]
MKPYVKRNKNDSRDAEAICEALGRPTMRFVAVKSAEQQATLTVHACVAGQATHHDRQTRYGCFEQDRHRGGLGC